MERLYQSLEAALFGAPPRASIPLKEGVSDTRRLVPENSPTENITSRLATALIAAANAQGVGIAVGTIVRRVFSFDRAIWTIENGCGQDLLKAGAAELLPGDTPAADAFRLTEAFVNWVATRSSAHAWSTAQAEVRNGQA